jgi:3-oxoacyl-[acyl-carrier protein] reductase
MNRIDSLPSLTDQVIVIYGAGRIGAAVARAFADADARVFVASRSQHRLDALDGVRTALVDATDPVQVRDHADGVVAAAGRIDVSFNLIGHGDVHGTPLIDMDVEDFVRPIESIVRSNFLTTQAAARHMVRQGGGLLLFFGGTGDIPRDYRTGGTMVAFDAQETLRRQLATELGPQGVRAVTIVTQGIPESDDPHDPGMAEAALIGRTAVLEDVERVAVFAASAGARAMTAATLNISAGAVVD